MNPDRLRQILRDRGCTRIFAKRLAPNDNSKNQIYLGGDYSALQVIPFGRLERDASDRSGGRRERLKAGVRLEWISEQGGFEEASGANLILYPKYPEVRLSGVLKGVANRQPGSVIASRQPGRWLFLGVGAGSSISAFAEGPDGECARWAEKASQGATVRGVFVELPVAPVSGVGIRAALRQVADAGWIDSVRLDSAGNLRPCHAENCGGYTLEARLGIRPNGRAEPDYQGWEVKQFAVRHLSRPTGGPITLFTPEPDGGIYRDRGVVEFLQRFGHPNSRGIEGRIDFGGIHRIGERHPGTGLQLELTGWDPDHRRVTVLDGGIRLVDCDGEPAAQWSFESLIEHWKRKHHRAVYVPSERRAEPRAYRYGRSVLAGMDTDFALVLQSLATGNLYYDPGIKLERSGGRTTTKRRSQFRIHFRDIGHLYRHAEWWNLDD